MIRTSDLRGTSDFYYKHQNAVVPESWRKMPRQSWPKQVMVAMGICWRGKSHLYLVPESVKNQR